MSDVERLQQQAYEEFSSQEYEKACKTLLQLELRLGTNAQLSNDIAVALFKAGQLNQSIARFKEATELEGKTIVTDNLFDVIEEQKKIIQELHKAKRTPGASSGKSQAKDLLHDLGQRLFSQVMENWCQDSAAVLHEDAKKLSDAEWLQAVIDSVDSGSWNNHLMPVFAPADTQSMFVGSSGRTAMTEGSRFISFLLKMASENGLALGNDQVRIGDFGSGWGRYTRFMQKYAHPDNLYGLEVQASMVERSRKEFGRANFIKVEPYPPTALRDNFFDLIFGYSVFSHLAPACADAWIAEFARIVRPGGLVIMTTQGRSFIDFCEEKRQSGDMSHPWFKCLAESFIDTRAAFDDYDNGGFLFSGTTQEKTYGEALISKGYIEKHWQKDFELVHFVDDRGVLPQACFVLRRKRRAMFAGWHEAQPASITAQGVAKRTFRPETLMLAMSPRVGSTALASALTSAGCFGDVREYFNPRHTDFPSNVDVFAHWRNIRLNSQSSNGVTGFKTCWLDFAPLVDSGFDRVHLKDATVVYLDRKDQIGQAISNYRAKQTSQWHLLSGDEQQGLSEWDVDAIIKEYHWITEEKAAWVDYFARREISPLCIDYEDICDDLPKVVRSIGAYCGIDAEEFQADIQTDIRKFSSDCPEDVINTIKNRLSNL
ncbi:Stf0 family sulfotransferase [Uliginosibacterium sp. 31-16]|uniref:Stf0 family sulfotransferase n=1 Tax=Uliginosibacterium sp. 31-16 TaxID=3068315 RepID=UPI00273EF164|nr:Stf0 family sulfotransferase [Uliginosibacterium sp. 31-16]MDP5240690.1 Stf0 family sulfotransferase [Uliginosibacterium sp. 31-16]